MLDQERIAERLQTYLPVIYEVILDGFRSRRTRYAEDLSKHTPRTRACLTNDLIVDSAKRKLTPMGIGVTKIHSRILFIVPDIAIIHFKKLDHRKIAKNYPTLFAIEWNKQLELPGIPATLPRLVAGFIPVKDWTATDGIYLTKPKGDDVEWVIPLAPRKPTIISKPEEKKDDRTSRRRVRRRRKDTGDASEGTGSAGG